MSRPKISKPTPATLNVTLHFDTYEDKTSVVDKVHWQAGEASADRS